MVTKNLAGAAALILAATTLHADPGSGKGGGQGKGGGDGPPQAQSGKGGPGAKMPRNRDDKAGNGRPQSRAERDVRAEARPGKSNGKAKGPDSGIAASARAANQDNRGPDRTRERKDIRAERGRPDPDSRTARQADLPARDRDDRRWDDADRQNARIDSRDRSGERFRWAALKRRDVVEGCPPGLAKKANGCMPPGLVRQRDDDWRDDYDRPDWWGFDGYQGRYYYNDGRLLQIGNAGSVLGYLPLLGGALAPGNLWPSYYEQTEVPDYYQNYYNLGSEDNYRYYDDAFYSVDPQTQAISAIAALLTGDDFAVGQPLPDGYDVYNVPYNYRDEYTDGPDAQYRYSDGYVYEVDPTTQLIRTAIELLT